MKKKNKNKEYLETAKQYHTEEIKNLNHIENREKRNLFVEATVANEGMIVYDRITFEDWCVNEKFKTDNMKYQMTLKLTLPT